MNATRRSDSSITPRLVVVVLLSALAGAQVYHSAATPAEPRQSPEAVSVMVVHPRSGGMDRRVSRPGSLHAFEHAQLYAKASGYLQHQSVDIGSRIKQGQVLAEIYAPELQAAVQQAQAALDQAKAKVEVNRAEVKLRKIQYQRYKQLVEKNAVEAELADEKMEAWRVAQAELAHSEATTEVMRAQLASARAIASYTSIHAPFSGVVTQRYFHEGDFIRDRAAGGRQPVLAVARTDRMRVIVYVPDPDVPYTHVGCPATIRVDALQDREFKGKVSRTANAENYDTRAMRTEIDLENPDGSLVDGMYGTVTIELGRRTDAVTIPSATVQTDSDGKRFVFIVRHNKAHKVPVTIDLDDGIHAEARSGLKPDDEVIVGHSSGLVDGATVKVVEKDAQAH